MGAKFQVHNARTIDLDTKEVAYSHRGAPLCLIQVRPLSPIRCQPRKGSTILLNPLQGTHRKHSVGRFEPTAFCLFKRIWSLISMALPATAPRLVHTRRLSYGTASTLLPT